MLHYILNNFHLRTEVCLLFRYIVSQRDIKPNTFSAFMADVCRCSVIISYWTDYCLLAHFSSALSIRLGLLTETDGQHSTISYSTLKSVTLNIFPALFSVPPPHTHTQVAGVYSTKIGLLPSISLPNYSSLTFLSFDGILSKKLKTSKYQILINRPR
jgi:hypothetical protein